MNWYQMTKPALILLFFLLSSAFVRANISATVKCSEAEVTAGRPITGRVIINGNDLSRNLKEVFLLPENAKLISPDTDEVYELKAGGNTLRLFAFQMPVDSVAGEYQIRYQATDADTNEVLLEEICMFRVAPVENITIAHLSEGTEIIKGGDTYRSTFLISNMGNVNSTVNLVARSSDGEKIILSDNNFMLQPGERKEIIAETRTSHRVEELTKHFISLTAHTSPSEEYDIKPISVGSIVYRDIAPFKKASDSTYWTISSRLAAVFIGDEDTEDFYMEFTGDGFLTEEQKTRIRWLVRTPSTDVRGGLRAEERYSLWIDGQYYSLWLGDHSFTLSELTELYYYGRGAKAQFQITPQIYTGAFYHEEGYRLLEEDRYGAYVGHQLNENLLVQVNYLHRDLRENTFTNLDPDVDLLTAILKYDHADWLKLEGEIGYSNNSTFSNDTAYRVEASGTFNDTGYYNVNHIWSNPNYFGYYNDNRSSTANIRIPLSKRVGMLGSISYNEVNLDKDPARGAAAESTHISAGPEFRINKNLSTSVEGVYYERVDKMNPSTFDFDQRTVRGAVNYFNDRFSLGTRVEIGEQRNNLTNNDQDFFNISAFGSYYANEKITLSLFAEHGDARFVEVPTESTSVGGSIDYTFSKNSRLSVNASHTKYEEDTLDQRSDVAATYFYHFRNGHELRAGIRYNRGERRDIFAPGQQIIEDETYYYISYSIPFDIPVGQRKNVGIVKGSVFANGDRNEPIENIALSIEGRKVSTDRDGNFVFPKLRPGTYALRVEQMTIGAGYITDVPNPLMIEVVGGEQTVVDFKVVRSVSISGNVAYQKNGNGNGLRNGNGHNVNRLILEISNGQVVQRVETDGYGNFQFSDALPGTWTLKLYEAGVTRGYEATTWEQTFTLEPGESRNVEFKLVPRERKIRIIDEGELTQVTMSDRKAEKAPSAKD